VRLRLGIVALMVLGFLTGCGSKPVANAGAAGHVEMTWKDCR
jgi:hypothetical protein